MSEDVGEPDPYIGPPRFGMDDEPIDPNAFTQPPAPYVGYGYPPPHPGPYGPAAPYGYGYPPPVPLAALRPGTITSASVLAYIESALLLFVTLFLAAFADDPDTGYRWVGLAAAANVVSAGLLISGAVLVTNRTAVGRIFYSAGSAVVGVSAVWWATTWDDAAAAGVVGAVLFTILLIIGLPLLWSPESHRWFAAKQA